MRNQKNSNLFPFLIFGIQTKFLPQFPFQLNLIFIIYYNFFVVVYIMEKEEISNKIEEIERKGET